MVVFNHIIAFQLVKVNPAVRQLWYAITVFHMPAFIFVSGFLSKSKQNVLKNIQNLLVPYILGYSFTWAVKVWLGYNMDYDILRPSGTVMWYVLALFVYRLTIEAFGRIRFIVPLSIIFSLEKPIYHSIKKLQEKMDLNESDSDFAVSDDSIYAGK